MVLIIACRSPCGKLSIAIESAFHPRLHHLNMSYNVFLVGVCCDIFLSLFRLLSFEMVVRCTNDIFLPRIFSCEKSSFSLMYVQSFGMAATSVFHFFEHIPRSFFSFTIFRKVFCSLMPRVLLSTKCSVKSNLSRITFISDAQLFLWRFCLSHEKIFFRNSTPRHFNNSQS